MSRRRCDYNGPGSCGNSIPITDVACHLHREAYEAIQLDARMEAARSRGEVASLKIGKLMPNLTAVIDDDPWKDLLVNDHGVPESLADGIVNALEGFMGRGLDIPDVAVKSMPDALWELIDSLNDNGVHYNYIRLVKLAGMTRITSSGTIQRYPDFQHAVVTVGKVALDMFTSLIVPANRGVSILDQFPDWANPFIAHPLIANIMLYRDEDSLIHFADSEIQRVS